MSIFPQFASAGMLSLAAMLLPNATSADEAAVPARLADQVTTLVDRLDADTLKERADAERKLQDLGPAALPHLPNPETLSAGASDALQRVRRLLEEQQARQAIQPGRVTLAGNRSLEEIIAAIASQTGNSLDASTLPPPLRQRTLRVDFNQTLFWQAVHSLTEKAPIRVRSGEDLRSLRFEVRDDGERARAVFAVVGPFRIDAVSAEVRPDYINPDRRLLRLTLELQTEPRLRPLFIHVADDDLTITSSGAHAPEGTQSTFPPLSPQARRELPVDKPGPVRISHDVVLPGENASLSDSSINLKGTIDVEVAAAQQPFTFRHLDEPGPVTRRHGGVRVILKDVEQAGADLLASLQIAYESGGPHFESHRAWVFHNDVELTIGDVRHRPAESETIVEGAAGAGLRYRFAGAAPLSKDAALRYTAPALISRVPVKFSIKDIAIGE